MKAIETRYKGCRFRSRTEARWAVFFDALGWQWKFEPEGYILPSGWYLPDFHVGRPRNPLWFEVKPYTKETPNDPRWMDLARESGTPVLTAYGMHRTGDRCEAHAARMTLPNGRSIMMPRPFWMGGKFEQAWDRASSARFEFGESG